jgi:hypothetical protein
VDPTSPFIDPTNPLQMGDGTTGGPPNKPPPPGTEAAPADTGGVGDAIAGAADAVDGVGSVLDGASGCLDGCGGCSLALLATLFLTAGTALALFR